MARPTSRQADSTPKDPAQGLDASVRAVPGVGPAMAERLAERGVRTIADLLFLLPRTYEDRRGEQAISSLQPGLRAAVRGQVVAAGMTGGGRGRRYEVAIDDGTGVLRLVYFNFNPYRMRMEYKRGEELWAYGLVTVYRGARQMAHPEVSRQAGQDREQGLIGVYPELGKIHRKSVRRVVLSAVDLSGEQVEELLPPALLARLELPPLQEALAHLHRPTADDDVQALVEGRSLHHKRLAFDEFLLLQVALLQRRASMRAEPAPAIPASPTLPELAQQLLPFSPTRAQLRVLDEIGGDLAQPKPMARLLQGDVGSGKTAAAAVAMAAVARAGLQSAILVPTEILAEQHLRTLRVLLEGAQVRVAALTGSARVRERRALLHDLSSGAVQVVVGTHALLQPDVEFAALGLVIIDEQHRFGVVQRTTLAGRGPRLGEGDARAIPHQLVMTATPIPRSLAMTLYGDLSLSVLDEMPPGRRPVHTELVSAQAEDHLHLRMDAELQRGGRIFVVYPLVEESENLDLADATAGAETMRGRFPQAGVALVHGRMVGSEKEAAMAAFAEGHSRILVATTVIEVGIDVPEATLMVVHNAERFGLSQLHQLRGRVGRGRSASSCVLVHGGAGGADAWRRLKVMEASSDGFRIAEEDLAIRGPGDLTGTKQAGLPSFVFADVVKHGALLEQARRVAIEVVAADPRLERPEHAPMRRALEGRFRASLELMRSG
ncbi:MAG: ATP-dependent DNA helicase RecG [Pseudomonadota bacterium]